MGGGPISTGREPHEGSRPRGGRPERTPQLSARQELLARLQSEARDVHEWSNGPGDRYGWHDHSYTKILYCLEGSIDFIVAPDVRIHLEAGDRMELPAGTSHSAVVGDPGVVCAEGKARGR